MEKLILTADYADEAEKPIRDIRVSAVKWLGAAIMVQCPAGAVARKFP